MDNVDIMIKRLEDSIDTSSFVDVSFEVSEELERLENSFAAVERILKLMEKYPEVEYGAPGPLVHFMEIFYQRGYEEELIRSLKRKPTRHTVWMMNRIMNGVSQSQKNIYKEIFENIVADNNIEQDVRDEVKHYLSLAN